MLSIMLVEDENLEWVQSPKAKSLIQMTSKVKYQEYQNYRIYTQRKQPDRGQGDWQGLNTQVNRWNKSK